MEITCNKCGGTGEKFDVEKEDWASPIEDCEYCKGSGQVDRCEQFDHVPNRVGMCTVCGMEVVTEVDENGTPILE